MAMASVIRLGTVFAARKAPNIHSEIIRVYTDAETGIKMVDVDQYGATLANKDWHKQITFFAAEITYALRRGILHVILVR